MPVADTRVVCALNGVVTWSDNPVPDLWNSLRPPQSNQVLLHRAIAPDQDRVVEEARSIECE